MLLAVRTPFSCRHTGPTISIFAARVHAHQWGQSCLRSLHRCHSRCSSLARVNSLYRVRDGVVTQIVKGDPQWPQSFYPLATPVEIQTDDYLIGQCVYDNDDDRIVRVGYSLSNPRRSLVRRSDGDLLGQRITMRCAMSTPCIPLNRRKRPVENRRPALLRFDHVGTTNSIL